jgi:hypothetical protein
MSVPFLGSWVTNYDGAKQVPHSPCVIFVSLLHLPNSIHEVSMPSYGWFPCHHCIEGFPLTELACPEPAQQRKSFHRLPQLQKHSRIFRLGDRCN